MEKKRLESLIRYHQDGLDQYRQYISPSAQHLEEQTIKALKELALGCRTVADTVKETE